MTSPKEGSAYIGTADAAPTITSGLFAAVASAWKAISGAANPVLGDGWIPTAATLAADPSMATHRQTICYENAATNGALALQLLGLTGSTDVTTVIGALLSGWIDLAQLSTFTFGSETVTHTATSCGEFTVTTGSDLTGVLSAGDRFRCTASGTKDFIVTKITSTTLTLLGKVNQAFSGTITNPMFSRQKHPNGFSIDPADWTISASDTSSQSANSGSPVQGTWYNTGAITITVPIGAWRVEYETLFEVTSAGSKTSMVGRVGLAITSNSTAPAGDLMSDIQVGGASGTLISRVICSRRVNRNYSADTQLWLNQSSQSANAGTVVMRGDLATTIVRAVCTYL